MAVFVPASTRALSSSRRPPGLLVHALAEKVHGVRRPAVREAHGELREAVVVFDQLIAIAQRNQPTIDDLRHDGRRTAVPR
ncbi:hypothetical protein [Saccharopolyspora shandongensis]|uniref:hypothetical protein n=1 Tax=Saccharopolyspora shandongensis TaxID=418495 RepID=UPI00340E9704